MKQTISKLIVPFLCIILLLSACSKKDSLPELPPLPPTPVEEKGLVRFSTPFDFSGLPYHSSNLTAVVSIRNEKGEEVVQEKMLTLTLEGGVKTEALQLPVGKYTLTGFRLVYGSVQTHFAAPISGSARAALVQQPLAVAFTVTKTGGDISIDVLKVRAGERPALYGYASGAFDGGQSDADPNTKIKLRAQVQIGDVLYDSIPASLQLSTWNSSGEMTTSYRALKGGTNEISLLKSAVRFRLHVTLCGTSAELTLNRQEVNEDTLYVLSSARDAKLLKAEMTYKLVNGAYVPQSKTEYLYNAAGRLGWINYYRKRADNSTYLAMKDEFHYAGTEVQAIRRYNEGQQLTRTTSFSYNGGKVSSISETENGQQTTGTVEYYNNLGPQVKIHYQYSGQTYTRDYIMTFLHGNVQEDINYTSNESSAQGLYDHDAQINPYIHMKWPNLFLSNSSKNNLTRQYKTYQYGYPDMEPYNYSYTYDSDGYPKEVITDYRDFPFTGTVLKTKTVYVY